MHRWLLLLMIALLPLRGWVGDAMAGEMLAQQLGAARVAASGSHAMPQAAQPGAHEGGHQGHDCMEHAQAPDQDSSHPQGEISHCPTCASCQVCSSVALAFTHEAAPATAFAPPRPACAAARFASAERAPRLKPPIS